jgi:hypothetical protein
MMPEDDRLDDLIHDVRSKCATLSDAAAALRTATPEKRKRLLALMGDQARGVAALIAAFDGA